MRSPQVKPAVVAARVAAQQHYKPLSIAFAVLLYFVCSLIYAHTEHVSIWHSFYCATANAMTEGDCNVNPTTWVGYVVNTIEHVGLVAVGAGFLGVFTSKMASALTRKHVEDAEERIKGHVEDRLRQHLGKDRQPPGV